MNYWKYIVMSLLGGIMLFHIIALWYISGKNYELTSKDYYQKDLAFDQTAEKLRAGKAFQWSCRLSEDGQWLEIHIKNDEGTKVSLADPIVYLYKPDNASLDMNLPLELHEQMYRAPAQGLVTGAWRVTVSAETEGQPIAWKGFLAL